MFADRCAWRAGVDSLPYSGRTVTREFQALISQLDWASTSAAVTGPPFQDVSRARLIVLKAVSLWELADTELDNTSMLSWPRCSLPLTSRRATSCSLVSE